MAKSYLEDNIYSKGGNFYSYPSMYHINQLKSGFYFWDFGPSKVCMSVYFSQFFHMSHLQTSVQEIARYSLRRVF